jgi:hypothetical protein
MSQYGAVLPNFGLSVLVFFKRTIPVTVTSARYIEMLDTFLLQELCRRNVNMQHIWFQQDDATAHTARASMQVVRDMFPQHVIFHFGDIHWLPHSHDLSICDYFLWGYLKSKLYINKPHNIQELKDSIHLEITNLEEEMLGRAMDNFKERLQECIQK